MTQIEIKQTISNKEVVDYINQQIGNGYNLEDIIEQLLSIGVAVIERVQSSRDVEFVKKETEKMILSFNTTLQELQTSIQQNVDAQISKNFNPDLEDSYSKKFANYLRDRLGTLNPVLENVKKETQILIENASKVSTDKLNIIETGIKSAETNFNPELETSYFGRLKGIINNVEQSLSNQLDDEKMGTFAHRLKEDASQLFGENSPIITTITSIITKYTEQFSKEIIALRESIANKEGVEEATAEIMKKTAIKGTTFEDEVFEVLEAFAKPFNDIVENTANTPELGTQAKKGDFIYTFKEGPKIIIEAKDKNEGLKPSLDYLNEAMNLRGINFSILLKRNEEQLPKQTGVFGFYENNKILTSFNLLEFAIRWSRLFLTKVESKISDGIDQTLVSEKLNQVLSKLKEISNIKTKLTNIENTVKDNSIGIKSIIDSIKSEIESLINEIDREVNKSEPSSKELEKAPELMKIPTQLQTKSEDLPF